VYGNVLVDDFVKYITRWIEWRTRGIVIMPASPSNVKFVHPQVIRFEDTEPSWRLVLSALQKRLKQ
jgi:hypothetical protein